MTTATLDRIAFRNDSASPRRASRWASDERADALLSGLLDDTREAAEQEMAELERQRAARAEALRQELARKDEERRREGDAMLAAEAERRRLAELRRTGRHEALAPVAEPAHTQETLDTLQRQLAATERARLAAEREAARLQQRSRAIEAHPVSETIAAPQAGRRGLFGLVAALVLVAGAILGAALMLSDAPSTTSAASTYAITTVTAHTLHSPSVVKGFEAVEPPAAEVVATTPRQPGNARTGRTGRTGNTGRTGTTNTGRHFDFDAGDAAFDGNRR